MLENQKLELRILGVMVPEDSISRFKLRGSRLLDAEPVLIGPVARSGSIWVEGWEPMLGGGRASEFGRRWMNKGLV